MSHTIPDSLVRYQHELQEAIRRDLAGKPARRRRRIGSRLVLAGGATAAVALGALSVLGSHAPSAVAPAAAAIIRHAAAALAPAPGTILHITSTDTQDNGDGTTVSWSQESFSESRPPYDTRLVSRQVPGTPPGVEQATVDGVPQVYDSTSNTIYIGPPPSNANNQSSATDMEHYRFSSGPTPGTYRVRMPVGFVLVKTGSPKAASMAHPKTIWGTVVVTAAQARALRNGTEIVRWTIRGKGPRISNPRVVQAPRASPATDGSSADPFSATFRGQILDLLRSGNARVVGHATVDGRDTIEIQSADGHTTYYVTPDSYTPVELTTTGTTGGTALHFDTYEQLPLTENADLLSLTAQHPTATIDRNVADYQAAEARLFPHG